MLPTVYIAAEDELGLALGRKLVEEAAPLTIYREENGHGYGTLKAKTPNFQKMGVHLPVLMLTDLDACVCPKKLIDDWLGWPPSKGFLFRICVREIEAWLLAHRAAAAEFLRVDLGQIPVAPEQLKDPKAELIRLAQKAPRNIRTGLTPTGSATIGPRYNELLGGFVRESWNPVMAAQNSPSLQRARKRIRQLADQVAV